MMLIFGLMLLLQTASCLDRFCRFDQSEPCYAALEHKLNLQMVLDAGEYDLKLIKIINNRHNDPLCRVKNDKIKECDLYKDRPEMTVINGTLIKHVIRADSGNYRLELYDGGRETSRDLQVIVEAPIGSVEVSIICSSSGVVRVSCSSEGDQLLYSWTLNGDPLMDGDSSIYLGVGTDGNISCSVKNHVSHTQKTIRVKPCPGATIAPVTSTLTSSSTHTECVCSVSVEYVLVWCFQLMVLLGLLGGFHIYMRHTSVINGTVIINHVIRADSGNYRLKLTDSDGTETSRDLQVIVEAPIGSVEVSIICSSSGVMRASCSSEGDQLLYSWTLNGDPLMDGNSSIDLNKKTDGNISCSVKNLVSHTQKTIRVKPCPGPTTASVTPSLTSTSIQTSDYGLELNCSFNQSDPCYAALGHKLNLLMMLDAKYELHIKKRVNNTADYLVCRVKYDKMKECDLYKNRTEVTVINGTLIIKRVIRADSGSYRLTLYNSYGTQTFQGSLQIIVEAPIGSVEMSIICSSSGVMRVSCSSEGDQLLYSWTLNGDSLMDGNSSIDLDEETDGNICCSVKNHVSHTQKTIRVKPCLDVSLIALGCVALILILLFITICYVYKKKQLKWTPAAAELIYADISHENKNEKKKTESLPADVVYAPVKVRT
ncbi:hypothetical protein QQF64_007559 [Cirrhinus molitorella]|uniref:Ig-like domain-containing protein n=1 Tax=Cirrhinus molitorella TaxID=172907 RepID=A0ABR3MAY6_9TELE